MALRQTFFDRFASQSLDTGKDRKKNWWQRDYDIKGTFISEQRSWCVHRFLRRMFWTAPTCKTSRLTIYVTFRGKACYHNCQVYSFRGLRPFLGVCWSLPRAQWKSSKSKQQEAPKRWPGREVAPWRPQKELILNIRTDGANARKLHIHKQIAFPPLRRHCQGKLHHMPECPTPTDHTESTIPGSWSKSVPRTCKDYFAQEKLAYPSEELIQYVFIMSSLRLHSLCIHYVRTHQ